ncbi:MAG: UDP-N-acetylmuramate dehydrogenase [Vibrionaceae bacterium]
MKLLSHTSLKHLHTFATDAHAKFIVEAHCVDDLVQIWQEYRDLPKLVLGEGSNVLFCEDFAGVVVLNRLLGKEVIDAGDAWVLHVAGGENWHELVRWSIAEQMAGLENLALIPGLVGSAPIQNIGAYGLEVGERIEYVDVLMLDTLQVVRLSRDDCRFGYRDSIFKHELKDKAIIVAVGFSLAKNWQPNLQYADLKELAQDAGPAQICAKVCEARQAKLPDPRMLGNAGSFFKNPVVDIALAERIKELYPHAPIYFVDEKSAKVAAGWLIDQCELKGKKCGGAMVHERQALVLVNSGAASAEDVIALARLVMQSVFEKFAIALEPEVRFIGARGEIALEKLCTV